MLRDGRRAACRRRGHGRRRRAARRLGAGTLKTLIHVHGHMAAVLGGLSVALWGIAWWRRAPRELRAGLTALCVGVAVQGTVGLVQYHRALPATIVWIHASLGAVLWLALMWCWLGAGRPAPARAAAAQDEASRLTLPPACSSRMMTSRQRAALRLASRRLHLEHPLDLLYQRLDVAARRDAVDRRNLGPCSPSAWRRHQLRRPRRAQGRCCATSSARRRRAATSPTSRCRTSPGGFAPRTPGRRAQRGRADQAGEATLFNVVPAEPERAALKPPATACRSAGRAPATITAVSTARQAMPGRPPARADQDRRRGRRGPGLRRRGCRRCARHSRSSSSSTGSAAADATATPRARCMTCWPAGGPADLRPRRRRPLHREAVR